MARPLQRPSRYKSPVTASLAVGYRLYGAIVPCDDLSSEANAGHDLIQWGFHDLMSFVSKRRAIKTTGTRYLSPVPRHFKNSTLARRVISQPRQFFPQLRSDTTPEVCVIQGTRGRGGTAYRLGRIMLHGSEWTLEMIILGFLNVGHCFKYS
jgi:hypothetical protein